MTDKNIETLIGLTYSLGVLFLFYYFMSKGASSNDKVKTFEVVKTIAPDKTIWDKLKVIGLVISAIAGLLYAVVKVVELFIDKK